MSVHSPAKAENNTTFLAVSCLLLRFPAGWGEKYSPSTLSMSLERRTRALACVATADPILGPALTPDLLLAQPGGGGGLPFPVLHGGVDRDVRSPAPPLGRLPAGTGVVA